MTSHIIFTKKKEKKKFADGQHLQIKFQDKVICLESVTLISIISRHKKLNISLKARIMTIKKKFEDFSKTV